MHELDVSISARRNGCGMGSGTCGLWLGGWPDAGTARGLCRPRRAALYEPVREVVSVFKHTLLDLTDKLNLLESSSEAFFDVPANCMLDFRVKLAFKSQFTIRLREDYRLTLLPERGQLVLAGPASTTSALPGGQLGNSQDSDFRGRKPD